MNRHAFARTSHPHPEIVMERNAGSGNRDGTKCQIRKLSGNETPDSEIVTERNAKFGNCQVTKHRIRKSCGNESPAP
jgi:hypothetical protein